jgi:hypothetical protein
MHKIRETIALALVCALVGLTTVAQGQTRYWQQRSDRYDNRQGGQIVARIDQRAARFQTTVERAIAQNRMNNTRREDKINQFVTDFREAITQLRTSVNRNQASNNDVQMVLDRAARIDAFLQAHQGLTGVDSDWQMLRSDLDTLAGAYNIAWSWGDYDQRYGEQWSREGGWYNRDNDANRGPGNWNRGSAAARLSGTFQLNASQSDDARSVVERAVRTVPYSDRQRVSEALLRRVDAPDMLAIDRQGRTVTLASSRAPQMAFDADGQQEIRSYPNAQFNSRVTATLVGDQLTINSSGDRATDFSVTFDPINNGRQLRVTRRLYSDRLAQPVVVQSVYDQVSPTARWDVYNGSPVYGDRNPAGRLSGTFRLNTAQSDNAQLIVERAVRDLAYSDRQRASEMLLRRMEAPEMLSIDRQGRTITLASSRAPQMTFDADGREQTEQLPNSNRTVRTVANLTGDQLTITRSGNRDTDFTVTFDPINNGRQLRVTRRLYSERFSQPIIVQSTYDQVSPVARWDITTASPAYGDNRYPNDRGGNYNSADYMVADGALIVARLNDSLDTTRTRAGDRFSLTVVSPPEYRDATIEGHIIDTNRSGRVTGRAELALAFDSIRMPNGRTARFDGTLDSVRTASGETLRVDTEGTVRDDSSQTSKTVQRAAIGTAIGALIGAIAGGGKGAAVGAVVGGGAGAGSVFIQGRNDLQLTPGTEITIRASAPNRRAM